MKEYFKWFLFIFFVVSIIICGSAGMYMLDIYKEGVDTSNIKINKIPHIYDSKDKEISVIYDNTARVYIKTSELPKYVYNSFVAIEDKRFYEHPGFDLNRFCGATVNYIFKKNTSSSGGGSTITQQLVKNITGDNEETPTRKMREIARSLYLENTMTKNEILENYINFIYFGQGSNGINEASLVFFGKKPSGLTIAEAAVLAAMPNAPEANNPYLGIAAKKRLLERQKLVLAEMNAQGYITKAEYDKALKQNIVFKTINDTAVNQYIRLAIKDAKDIIIESGLRENENEIESSILSGNIKIYTNLDVDYQNKVYQMMKSYFSDNVEASFVITTKEGKIISAISSRTGSLYDRVKTMTRLPGSTIKPLADYGPAFDMGILEPNSIVTDEEISVQTGNKTWTPTNWYPGYRGDCTVYDALAQSINTIAIRTLEKVGISNSMRYLKSFGITSLDKKDAVYPLAIGGITNGISPFEMARAYNVFNNDGMYRNISFIDKIVIDGKTIEPKANKHKVISKEANDMMNSCLRYVATNGSATKANVPRLDIHAKTGTTDDSNDYWLCGYNDDITAALWVGYDEPKSMNFTSGDVAALWGKLVSKHYK